MGILKWICWLRGYHRSAYAITAFEPPMKAGESGNCYGTTFPCETCGEILPRGSHNNAYVKLEWKQP